MKEYPMTFDEFIKRFMTEEQCLDCLYQLRWPNDFVCPKCGQTVKASPSVFVKRNVQRRSTSHTAREPRFSAALLDSRSLRQPYVAFSAASKSSHDLVSALSKDSGMHTSGQAQGLPHRYASGTTAPSETPIPAIFPPPARRGSS